MNPGETRTVGTVAQPLTRRNGLFGRILGILFLAYPFIDLVTHRRGVTIAIAGTLLLLFAAAYFGAFAGSLMRTERGNRLTAGCLAIMAALAIALPFLYGRSWIVLSFYVAILLTIRLPQRPAIIGIGLVVAFLFVQALLLREPVEDAAMSAIAAAAIGGLMLAFVNTRRLVSELRSAQDEVARLAVANERLRFARDLHDLLGHTLSLIALKSEVARKLGRSQPERAAQEVADVEKIARDALTEVRQAVSGYRQQGFRYELDHARSTLAAAGVTAAVRTSGGPPPEALDQLFGWALREAVTNVVRHAQAHRCEISVGRDRRGVHLRVSDDGNGGPEAGPGNGLTGLAERVAAFNGNFNAGPGPAGGFILDISVPLADPMQELPRERRPVAGGETPS
ncbi:MAG: sensor histidine kinase [Deinococcales bacterium]|jgi:two-component system, NarL family, sensor histidine kinase DesK